MQTTTKHALLSLDEKKTFARELWDYHDTTVQNDCAFFYCEKFDIGLRTFKEQIYGRRTMRPSQVEFVIEYLLQHTSERGIRELFLRLFDAQPEAYGYLIKEDEPLPMPENSKFERWKNKQLLPTD